MRLNGICPLGCAFLLFGISGAFAQEREIGPLPSLAGLVEKTAPAVVNITVTEMVPQTPGFSRGRRVPPIFEEFLEQQPEEQQGAGSGVIVDTVNGYVLTNHHVIANASAILVTLVDNRIFDATVIGSDPSTDLAVLQIDADRLTAIPFASTNDLLVGDYVVAIGNPFGLGQTVTSGIVSALGRAGGFTENRDGFEDFIQTDASINQGNSGGALVNLKGELVGINSAIISTGFGGGSVGIGFAIPSEMIVSVMGRLLEYGEVRRGLLGVVMNSNTPGIATDLGLGTSVGALVQEVTPDSAAEAAGIRIYDVIVGVDGERVSVGNELRNRIAMKLPGETVTLQIVRDGREQSVTAVLDAREDSGQAQRPAWELGRASTPLDGVEFIANDSLEQGIRVQSIAPDSLADDADLRPGDLITAINRHPVSDVENARQLVSESWTVVLEIEREARRRLLVLR
jgi:Do/DeqQ family serine protease